MSKLGDIREEYGFEAERYDQRRFSAKVGQYVTQVVQSKLLRYLVPSKTLELGVGTGRHAFYLSKHGFKVVGIDLSRRMLEQCRKKQSKGVSIDLCLMDAHRLHFSRASFDSVYCDRTFKFFKQPMKVLKEVYRVLKPNGRLVLILVPVDVAEKRLRGYHTHLFLKIRNKLFKSDVHETVPWMDGSLKAIAYSEKKIREMLEDASFEVLVKESVHNFPILLVRKLPRKLLLLVDKHYGKGSPFTSKILVVAKK